MKPDMHPEYKFVVFRDINTSKEFMSRTAMPASMFKATIEKDGTEYPLVTLDISSDSHPFYTGQQKLMDTEGRVEAYYRKYGFVAPPDPDEAAAEAAVEASDEAAPEATDE